MNKLLLKSILFFVLLSASSFSYSQNLEYCGTTEVDENWMKDFAKNKASYSTYRDCNVFVPITVHILGDDNGVGYEPYSTVFRTLEILNNDFAATGISFFLSGPLNYINNTSWYDHESFSIGQQMMNANNVSNTVNCYIVENAAGNCGYRTFDGDGIALAKSCNTTSDHTWAHEMGHYFALNHTFFGWEGTDYDKDAPTPNNVGFKAVELLDGSNCDTAGDGFCDTPPDYYSSRWGCDDQNENPDTVADPSGAKFKVDGSFFMSYAADRCQSRFSNDQNLSMCTYLEERIPDFISKATPLGAVVPSETELIFPINGQKVQNNVTLEWKENGSATYYVVEISRFPNMGLLSHREVVYGTTLDVFGLTDDKKYYWRLRTMNEYDFNYDLTTDIQNFETGSISSTDDYYEKHLKIYPNPASPNEDIIISLDSQVSEDVSINVVDLQGKNVMTSKYFIKNGENAIAVRLPNVSSGIYILTGKGQNHNFQEKLFIE